MSIILGHYSPHSFPFCLYFHSSQYYFCLEELDAIFFTKEMPLITKAPILKQLYNQKQSDFFKTKDNRTFIMTRTVLHIARLFNLYCLAELCKLSPEEILDNVAEPLLSTIQCDRWQTASPPALIHLRTDLMSKPLKGNEWFFTTPPCTATPCLPSEQQTIQKNRITYNKGDASMIHHWLTSSIHEKYSPNIAQSIKAAAKVKRQQQAIIETRQRRMTFLMPNKKTKLAKGTMMMTMDKKKQKYNMSITSNNNNRALASTFPPSPPALIKQHMQFPNNNNNNININNNSHTKLKRKRPIPSPQHDDDDDDVDNNDTKRPRIEIVSKDAPPLHNDNLLLLATQATQMRDLPLSPAVSPPSTVHPEQPPQRLPSLKTMILELSHHSNLDHDMDSRA